MSKVVIITDTHYGVRNDNVAFLNANKEFMEKQFFPYIDNNNIKTIVHLGDLVDRRKYINFNTAKRLREDFLQPLADRNIEYHQLLGNHDTYYKNTNEVNAIDELFKSPNFKIYKDPVEIELYNLKILFLPWICDENREQSLNLIRNTNAQVCMGHLEIQGFEMFRGSIVSHGDDRKLFDRFDIVLSGHFHHRSSDGCIFYLGAHSDFTWSDYEDSRGFHVFDTQTRELTFIENTSKMFKKIWYNDADEHFTDTVIDYNQFKNAIVKVVVQNKDNLFWFDKFIENIENVSPVEIQIVEDHLNLNLEDDDNIINEAESTTAIFKKYIDTMEIQGINKQLLEKRILDLYNEALAIE